MLFLMIWQFLIFFAGLVAVVKGADFLVDGASSLAKRLKVPEIIIGLTIVAFGTSAPELVVNVFSSIDGRSDLVLGNIIGSNVFNTLLILGIAGSIYPLSVQRLSVKREIPFSLAIFVIFFIIANDRLWRDNATDLINHVESVVLIVLFIVFLCFLFFGKKAEPANIDDYSTISVLKTWIYIIIGFTGLFLGGKWVVEAAVEIAKRLDVSEKLIGLTIVSIGTSLPELATSVTAAIKKRSDMAVGNVVGSNIFNLLFIMGVSGLISPIPFSPMFNFDLAVFGGATLLLFVAMFTGKRRKLDRWEALVMLFGYIFYMLYIIYRN